MQLTAGSTEDDLDRVALALFKESVNIGDKNLIYTISTTPGYNVGKDFCLQDQYEFVVARTTVLEAVATPLPECRQVQFRRERPTKVQTTSEISG
jgi:uncharacterized protein YcfJ